MKNIRNIFLFLIIFLLIIGGTFQHLYLRSISEKLLALAEKLSSDILPDSSSQYSDTLRELNSLWHKHCDTLSTMLEHELITNISLSLAELSAELSAGNYQQIPAVSARLTEQIQTLAKTERITLGNIF